jgi:hypothetical protein
MRLRNRVNSVKLIGSLLATLVSCAISYAQDTSYCNITGISVKRVSNAVQITIEADGLMNISSNSSDFFNTDAFSQGDWANFGKMVSVLPFKIRNARAKVPSFTDVGVYPISHVDVSIFPDSVDGVGVDLRVHLFTQAMPLQVSLGNNFSFSFSSSDSKTPHVWIKQTGDQRSIIITVTSDKRVEMPVERRIPSENQKPICDVKANGDLISITALNVTITEIALELAKATRRPILVDKDLKRYVSMYLPNLTLDQALAAIATTYGFAIDDSGSSIVISEEHIENLPSLQTSSFETIPLHNIKAEKARGYLPEFLLKYIRVDTDHNALVVSGSSQLVKKIRSDIVKLDQSIPMVSIEAVGVEFGSVDEASAFLTTLAQWDRNTLSLDSLVGDVRYSFAGKLPQNWTSAIQSKIGKRRTVIHAKPSITVMNGESADLFVGTQQLVKYSFFDMYQWLWRTNILRVDVGSSLSVSAWNGGSDQILIKVEPSLTTITDIEPGTGLPTLAKRKASAMLRITDGETLVIGGMSIDQKSAHKVGLLASSPQKENSTTELVWFITARIVKNGPDSLASRNSQNGP